MQTAQKLGQLLFEQGLSLYSGLRTRSQSTTLSPSLSLFALCPCPQMDSYLLVCRAILGYEGTNEDSIYKSGLVKRRSRGFLFCAIGHVLVPRMTIK